MIHIGTTRFTDETYEENRRWCKNNDWNGCIYGLPLRLSKDIKKRAPMYVIEMNNTQNKIMGIGKIVNQSKRFEYKIYSDMNYNRYIFKGEERREREKIRDKECLAILEKILFKGKSHMKRGRGITRLNPNKLKDNKKRIMTFLKSLFD